MKIIEILERKLKELGIKDPNQINDKNKQSILAAAGEHFHEKALEDMIAGLQLSKPAFEGEVWVVAEHD